MSHAILSVEDRWREYDVGLGEQASVRAMYELGDKSYKKDDAERNFSSDARSSSTNSSPSQTCIASGQQP